jgi:hypothetical protein
MKFSKLPSNVQHIIRCYEQAYTVENQHGIKWYSNAYEIASKLSQKHSIDINQVVGVIAALSPNNEWKRNCIDAENMITVYDLCNRRELNDKAIREHLESLKVCTFNANKYKAIEILMLKSKTNKANKVRKILFGRSGYKVVEFMNSILGVDDCCIDGHAYSIWLGERVPTTKTPPLGKKLRESIKADYRLAKQYINYDLGTKYKVSEIQAITWVTHKRIHS